MKTETRRAALRAAAKAALVMSIGCGGGTKAPPTTANAGGAAGPAGTELACPDYLDSLATAKRDDLAPDDPLREAPEVYGAFADVTARQAPRTQECCSAELVAQGSGAAHRWECCTALGGVPEGAEIQACTPWGPPCPPTMA